MQGSAGKHKVIASKSAIVYQEIGESLVKSSITTITQFNRFMIGTCFGAIPIFLGLMNLTSAATTGFSKGTIACAILVVVVFLFGSVMAILGYMPLKDSIGLQEPDSIKRAVDTAITFRRNMAWTAICALIVGVSGACCVVLFASPAS